MNDMRRTLQTLTGTLLLWILIILLPQTSHAQTGTGITLGGMLNGAKGQLAVDSTVVVPDTIYFSTSLKDKLDTPYQVKNIITFSINEYGNFYHPDSFSATVNIRVYYTLPNQSVDSVDQRLSINYDTANTYTMRSSFVFNNSHWVKVKILSITSTVTENVLPALVLMNEMEIHPVYKLSCTVDAVKEIFSDHPANPDDVDEIVVRWPAVAGADVYDLEWAYVDKSALDDGRYGNPVKAALIFENNTTRATLSDNKYAIPLLYDSEGVLYFRARAVQEKEGFQRIETAWSTDFSAGLGMYNFPGHERKLNWQSSITFAEDGKRKVVVQYFDGSLRSRQTVTKDNTTNTTVVAETFYDYQGRPAVSVLPTPTLNSIIKYVHSTNLGVDGKEYDKSKYDSLGAPQEFLTAAAKPMSTLTGTNQYYSPNNPDKNNGFNQFIPDGEGYAFAETEYMPDNTGRIRRQGGVGPTFKLGTDHETKYFYGNATKDLYQLFGTEVGELSHYFKNMTSDANGQYAVSYVDMHGRTIATALAGSPENKSLEDLPSKDLVITTDSLSGPDKNTIDGMNITSRHSQVVTEPGDFTFKYLLTPPVLRKLDCNNNTVCYTGLYELEIRITDDAYNQRLGGNPIVYSHKFDNISVDCNTPVKPITLEFSVYLKRGVYDFTKVLSVSRVAMEYYRDSVFLKRNVCTSYDEILEQEKAKLRNLQCTPDCAGCLSEIGSWNDYRARYMRDAGYPATDTADYRGAAWTTYQAAIEACNALCGTKTEVEQTREQMLLDMAAPSGQYALLSDSTSKYSIYYVKEEGAYPVYSLPAIKYLDEEGREDIVYDEFTGTYVKPQDLTPEQFSTAFKTSWAPALLIYHPEYCKLIAKEKYVSSDALNVDMEAVDTYAEAKSKGYLNPLKDGSIPFPGVFEDPLAANFRTKLKDKLDKYSQRNGSSGYYSMWSVAAISTQCTTVKTECADIYKTPALAFNERTMCPGDLDMAWRSFRGMYLNAKREVLDEYLNGLSCVKVKDLTTDGKQLRFFAGMNQLENEGFGYLTNSNLNQRTTRDSMDVLEQRTYEENCRAYVNHWIEQLAPCNYNTNDLHNIIIPKLIAICKEGSDVDHPYGSSTVRPGSIYSYSSFDEVLNEYNQSHGIINSMECNPDVITRPKPYDKQVAYSDVTSYQAPTNCQCDKLSALNREYTATKRFLETFSGYLKRTCNVTISQSDLNILLDACKASESGSSGCTWMTHEITIPAVMQCNVAPACVGCTEVNNLYTAFRTAYPDIVPAKVDDDALQIQKNDFFAVYMNKRLGFVKDAGEYLAFMDSCALPRDTGVMVCKSWPPETKQFVSSYSNGGVDNINDILRTRDSGYVLAGSTTGCGAGGKDAYIIKTDSSGALLWSKTYGGNQEDEFIRLKRTADNGFIGIGNTYSYCYDYGAILVIKLDSVGNVKWNKIIHLDGNYGGRGTDIIQTSEGRYAFSGLRVTAGIATDWVTGMLSKDGRLQWMKQIGSAAGREGISILEHKDTLLLATSLMDNGTYDAVVLKQDKATGNMLDMSVYDVGGQSNVTGSIVRTRHGYKLSMINNFNGVINGALLDIHSNGDIVAIRKINSPGVQAPRGWTTVKAEDWSLLVAQSMSSPSADVYWHKIGSNNGILWSSHVRVEGSDFLSRILENSDGTLAGGGTMNGTEAMLMLTTTSGKAGCNDTVEIIGSADLTGSSSRKVIVPQTTVTLKSRNVSVVAMKAQSCSPVRNIRSCPGLDSCYIVGDGPLLCGNAEPVFDTEDINAITKCADSSFFAESAATVLYKAYIDSVRNDFDAAYLQMALGAASLERFGVTYGTSEYHYTLYYYDQAGNLVKTVPPAGVVKITRTGWVDSVLAAKANKVRLVPPHTLVTNYRYNTLNEVVAQHTPDAGLSKFWYDRLGRLSVSQNAKQLGLNHYSYTFYDDLGRISEVGELSSGTAMTHAISHQEDGLNAWFNRVVDSRTQITNTTYDIVFPFFESDVLAARNLRNRVSWTALYTNADSLNRGSHSTASFYSYDIHGNVDTLVQDYKEGKMAKADNRFKRMVYRYDLLSGNVNEVAYQPGSRDAFYHRYTYDAENRITNVQTSRDKVYWENEAYYQYYKHGPLARTVLGQQQVQGVDYAYTLQGWLKGVNSTALTAASDPGNDGAVTPKDVFGFALHYYGAGDYKPVNASRNSFAAAAGDFKPLYNGNIGAISQHLSLLGNPLLYNYNYDALNRIKGMQAYSGLNTATNTWNPLALDDFKESISYDANGNILRYNRNGNKTFAGKPLAMDSLVYSYKTGTNKLDFIDDKVNAANYDNDIDAQLAGNYEYDGIGNLVKDRAGNIDGVTWNIYGKIASIVKTDGTVIRYTYDVAGNRISKDVNGAVTWYVRDATGNVMSTYTLGANKPVTLSEIHLYGSNRLGISTPEIDLTQGDGVETVLSGLGSGKVINFIRGKKFFELSNHLGNVLATVSDKKLPVLLGGSLTYNADVVSVNEYYPFGMLMPGRSVNGSRYRYGFNGKENDNEVKGEGNQQDYGFRIYDPRVGKFLSVDPLAKSYPWNSPYSYAEGDVIRSMDLDGLEKYIIHQRSFAPWEFFGEIASGGRYKYSGDHRGFSILSDDMIKTKVSTAITVDISTAKATLTAAKQFGNTIRYDGKTDEALKTAPIVNPEVNLWNAQRNGSEVLVKARIEGQAPLAPFPILDPISSLIDQPIVWTGKTSIDNHISDGYINVSYSLIGKGFPAFESFIEDANGTRLFIGAYTSPAKNNILQALSGSELSLSRTFNTKISTDQDGNFNGVYTKDRNGNDVVVSPATYNTQTSNASPARDLPGKKIP
jgi:RHS repeat-associated protein